MSAPGNCWKCDGRGRYEARDGSDVTCLECDGTGTPVLCDECGREREHGERFQEDGGRRVCAGCMDAILEAETYERMAS